MRQRGMTRTVRTAIRALVLLAAAAAAGYTGLQSAFGL
jgi:hypothetical protein